MNENKGSRISDKMHTMSNLMAHFQINPDVKYGIKDLSCYYPDNDLHDCLTSLEEEGVLRRSKIFINGKPVTQWQHKAHDPTFQCHYPVSEKYSKRRFKVNPNYHIEADSNSWRKTSRSQHLDFSHTDSFFSPSSVPSVSQVLTGPSILAPRRLTDTKETSTSLSIDHRRSQLNPHSPEFIPSSIKTLESAIETRKTSKVNDLNNLNSDFITALTKNPVSVLYEFAQQRGMSCDIDVIDIAGPSHKPSISMVVTLNGRKFDTIVAASKKEGKRLAADAAVRKLISEGHFSERFSKPFTKTSTKDTFHTDNTMSSNHSMSKYDKMASLVYNKLAKLIKDLSEDEGKYLAGRKVVSAIILQDEKRDKFEVVSLATGNRCISGDKISLQGKVVNDCHAEIIVRRAFILFIYQQLFATINDSPNDMEIFEEYSCRGTSHRRFKLRSYIKFHLYISTAPCGDGALFCNRENGQKKTESEFTASSDHIPIFEHPVQGLLRSKIEGGEGTIPVMNTRQAFQIQTLDGIFRGERLKTMSCSDKIARWNYLGAQGALLSQFVDEIFFQSISLGNLYNAGHLSRAVCCRLQKDKWNDVKLLDAVNHPDLSYVHVADLQREIDKSNELSINWTYDQNLEIVDGVTGRLTGLLERTQVCSRISKASLFRQYHKLSHFIGHPYDDNLSYRKAKLLSIKYEEKKQKFFDTFHKLEYGSWICKPSEQNDFTDKSYF